MDPSLPETQPLELADESAEEATEADPREELEKRFRNGASWFFWVAGLSLVNSAVALFDAEWGFVFGLGFTQVVDAVAAIMVEEAPDAATGLRVAGFVLNAGIVGVVALMGWLAHKRMQWVFFVGLALYTVDALLFLVAGDFLSLAFHGWVFFAVTSGLVACRKLAALDAAASPAPATEQALSPA